MTVEIGLQPVTAKIRDKSYKHFGVNSNKIVVSTENFEEAKILARVLEGCLNYRSRISSVGRALDCRAGGRGLEITKK